MFKPEDIPMEFVYEVIEKARRSKIDAELGNFTSNEQEIADLLNAAIKAGIVSPPCRILRSQWGSLQTDAIYIDDNAAQAAASPGDSSEHWKGQTE